MILFVLKSQSIPTFTNFSRHLDHEMQPRRRGSLYKGLHSLRLNDSEMSEPKKILFTQWHLILGWRNLYFEVPSLNNTGC